MHTGRSGCICLSMYYYGLTRKKHSEKRKIISALCLTVLLLLAMEYRSQGFLLEKEIVRAGYEKMIAFELPFFHYFKVKPEEMSIERQVMGFFFPVLTQSKKALSYQTEIESAFSYEMILAMEASDETEITEPYVEPVEKIEEKETEIVQSLVLGSNGGKTSKEVSYSLEKLEDFDYLLQNFYRVDKTTTINGTQLNAKKMLSADMTLSHNADSPQILIYHTHSQEGYADSIVGDSSTTVVGVGAYLAEILKETYGLNVIHHKGEYDVVSRDNAYSSAGPALKQILEENPGIEVVIDLHRDGVAEDTRLVTMVDGVETAKIMFVNGLSHTTSVGDIAYLYNPYLSENLAFSFQVQLAASEYYPEFSRGVYLKGYRYNLHYCPKSLLVEVGAQTNTVQEAMNAMVPLADILHKVVTDVENSH